MSEGYASVTCPVCGAGGGERLAEVEVAVERDMDLVRQILTEVQKASSYIGSLDLELSSHERDKVSYHVLLLKEAGLIEAQEHRFGADSEWHPIRLTWQGHEFLEAIRQDQRWGTVKRLMADAGGFVAMVAKELAISLLKEQVGLGP